MNLGLGNLATLKGYVLAEAMAATTTFDARLAAIGKGIAALFEKECNRKFGRTVADTFEASAESSYLILPRYPIESIASIEQRDDMTTGWVALPATTILNRDDAAGYVDFGAPLGSHASRLKFTFTGGFYFETLEPTDVGYPTAVPAGSTALPADLQHAWLIASQKVFERTRSLSTSGVKVEEQRELPPLKLSDDVLEMLKPFRRFA